MNNPFVKPGELYPLPVSWQGAHDPKQTWNRPGTAGRMQQRTATPWGAAVSGVRSNFRERF